MTLVVEDAQVAGHNLVLEYGAGGNVDAVTVVSDYDDGAAEGHVLAEPHVA